MSWREASGTCKILCRQCVATIYSNLAFRLVINISQELIGCRWFGENASSETPGAVSRVGRKGRTKFLAVFENFRPAFSPDPTDCPWVSEDGVNVTRDLT